MGLSISVFLAIVMLLQLVYSLLMIKYYTGWKQTENFIAKARNNKTKITVIVVARNEAGNIETCLNGILNQNYPEELFEVILVDDNSTDDTLEIAAKNFGTQITILQNDITDFGKKAGITKAVKVATGELLVTTDADCLVLPTWLKTIASYYETYQPKMITGLVEISETNGLLNAFQSLDVVGMMGVTAGAIAKHRPQMCNGANLAYTKAAFISVNGYEGVEHWPTGDDQLLMFKIMEKYPCSIRFLKSVDSIVTTKPVNHWTELWHQRLRWVSKSKAMPKLTVNLVLILAYFYNLSIVVTIISGVVSPTLFIVGLIMLINKFIIEWPIVSSVSKYMGQGKVLKWFPVIQALHIIYVLVIGPASQFFNYKWKDRLLKQVR